MRRLNCSIFIVFVFFIEYTFQVLTPLDPVHTEKCRLRCTFQDRPVEMTCLRQCLTIDVKPGKCPAETNSTIPPSEKSCSNTCRTDPQCPNLMKCCRHDCGVVCMTPTQLDLVPGLPPIPTSVLVHVNETEITSDGLPINVRWTFHSCSAINNSVQFILEEKHSYVENGTDVIADKWNFIKRTHRKHAVVKNLFEPGLYYQFRVYSVSENGTLGPSQASTPYQILPNITELTPGIPVDFGVGAQSWGNGSLRYLLVWKKPPSVVPIYKYKLTWSMLKNDSLLQHEKYLAGNLEHHWLSSVLPKTEYFFEIYAVVKFDDKKIPGKAARILVRTHDHPSPKKRRRIQATEVDVKYRDTISALQVNKLYWIQDNLFASVIWEPISEDATTNYSITWIPTTTDCKDLDGWYVAQTADPNFEIYDLIPGCDYAISIKAIYDQILYTGDTFLPLESCTKKLRKSRKMRKEFNFLASDFMKQFQNKPIEIVDCPLSRNETEPITEEINI